MTGWEDGGDSYALGTLEGWDAFEVARFHGIEEISRPFTYDIALTRDARRGPVDTERLIGTEATLVLTHGSSTRAIHGVVFEIEELERTEAIFLYRLMLAPHVMRSSLRRRSRNFVDCTLHAIVSAVLENESPRTGVRAGGLVHRTAPLSAVNASRSAAFHPPVGFYRWEVKDTRRLLDARTYPYVAQYAESDFDLVCRLLAKEGLSYHFEHGHEGSALVIRDASFAVPSVESEQTIELRRGPRREEKASVPAVRSFRRSLRLGARSVTVRDFDYLRSRTELESTVTHVGGDVDVAGHFEFPANDENETKRPAERQAQIRAERLAVERDLREGVGNVRTLRHGTRVDLRDADGLQDAETLLIVKVESFAIARYPEGTMLDEEEFGLARERAEKADRFECRFVALRDELPFRPRLDGPRPLIAGVQTARVTAEDVSGEKPVVHADQLGRVRLRFPWDERPETPLRPSSGWIRVSQPWAGQGYGAHAVPRVGHEVLVAYHEGNPERPVIVGRVYNAQNVPPSNAAEHPMRSTWRSQSATLTQEVEGFNELRLDDRRGAEEISLHAQDRLREVVLGRHTTSVGGDQDNQVDGGQTNTVGGARAHTVLRDERVEVRGDRRTTIGASEARSVGASQLLEVKALKKEVVGERSVIVEQAYALRAARRTVTIDGEADLRAGSRRVDVRQDYTLDVGGALDLRVGDASLRIADGTIVLSAGGHTLEIGEAGGVLTSGSAFVAVVGGSALFEGTSVALEAAPDDPEPR